MGEQIKAIRFDIQQIGKHVKGSKKRFTWIFSLNHKNHTIVVDFSFISGKVKVVVDRKTLLQNELPTNVSFQHPFTLDGYALNILQQGQTFELRINNKVFSHLYNQVKTNTEFKQYEDQVKDIKVDEANFQGNVGKKITLNIGGMKKKNYKSTAQSQDWNSFGGESGFPNYFGQSTTVTQKSQTPVEKPSSSLLDDEEQSFPQNKKSEDFVNFQEQVSKPAMKKTQQIDFFADDNESKPQGVISPSQQHLSNIMNTSNLSTQKQDFNTMQNLFATMNVSGQQNAQGKSSLDFFNQSAEVSVQNKPNQQMNNINLGDFNTMQQLFATSNPVQQPNLQNINTINQTYQLSQQQQIYNTMGINMTHQNQGNMFSTSVPNNKQSNPFDLLDIEKFKNHAIKNQGQNMTPQNNSNVQNVNMQDFNTMQNLFKTQNPIASNQNGPQSSDFNTIENLFKTTNNQNSAPPTAQQFNTMQNMFNTQTNGLQQPPTNNPQPSAFGKKSKPLEQDLI